MRVGVHRLHDARVPKQGLNYLQVLASFDKRRAEGVALNSQVIGACTTMNLSARPQDIVAACRRRFVET